MLVIYGTENLEMFPLEPATNQETVLMLLLLLLGSVVLDELPSLGRLPQEVPVVVGIVFAPTLRGQRSGKGSSANTQQAEITLRVKGQGSRAKTLALQPHPEHRSSISSANMNYFHVLQVDYRDEWSIPASKPMTSCCNMAVNTPKHGKGHSALNY